MTYSHMDNSTLPSALRGFTSEFGKGSGGSLLLLSPAHLLIIFKLIQDFQILPLGLNPCFSTSFNQHHRRWMCILQHF
ncbi:conserved hypothetical protein [Acinetobacter sp. 8I-beige]|nr:conserved hypothetical protein [Acinetobacter sp. 8I-beige]